MGKEVDRVGRLSDISIVTNKLFTWPMLQSLFDEESQGLSTREKVSLAQLCPSAGSTILIASRRFYSGRWDFFCSFICVPLVIQADIDESHVKIRPGCLVMAHSQLRLASVSPSAHLQWPNASDRATLGVKSVFRIFVGSDDSRWTSEAFSRYSTSQSVLGTEASASHVPAIGRDQDFTTS